ncbi:MAG: M23 family metallopeptidase [Rhodospirillaceae bacterium]|nr:M23 family metallopeptidase [Rhodospirillaceae bacterium]MYI50924.1 M23 family metallopeptidase [Rhodospirillaceae bacterium]
MRAGRSGPDAEPGTPADYRKTGSDLRIPIVEEDEIPLVRAVYEEDAGRAAPAVPKAGAAPAGLAAHAAGAIPALKDAFRGTPRTSGEAASGFARWGDDSPAAPAVPGLPGNGAPGGAVGAPAAPAVPDATDAPPAAGKTARTKPGARPGGAAGRQRQARDTRTDFGGRDFNVRGKRLPTRTAGFEADLRANILSGLAIAAALGAAVWYFTGPGTTPPPQTVEADKAEVPAPKDSAKKPPAAGPPPKAAIFLPAKRIAPAAASALGNLEYRLTPDTVDRSVVSARGDTFGAMLRRAGVRAEETVPAVAALRGVYNPRTLPIGLELKVVFEAPGVGRPRFLGYRFDSSADRMVRVSRLASGAFGAKKVDKIVTEVYSRADGQIETSLFGAGVKAGVPPRIMLQMVRLFSFAVDFQRDLHGGEKFQIMYRSQKDESSRIVRHSDIVYTSLTVGGKARKLYVYEPPKGPVQYLNERGQGNRRALMKTPIDGARLTSRFGYRKHPLLGFTKLHAGVDFGARPGTPIYAAGDGTIVKIGWFGTYGRYIRIRHGSVYETAYAHMSRFRRGLRVGSRVKQGDTVGYVGSSGRSTGPHLHYEVIRNGRQVNPMKIALPSRKNLKGRELKQFLAHRKEIDARYAALGKANERQRQGSVQTVRSDAAAGCRNGVRTDPKDTRPCN